MFKSISWQEYLLTVALLAAAYYLFIISVFYYRDIWQKIKGATVPKAKVTEPAKQRQVTPLMGAISNPIRKKIPLKQSVIHADEFTFESDPEEMRAAHLAESPAAELTEALDDLFITLAIDKAGRTDYIINIRKLFEAYPSDNHRNARQDVYGFIADSLKTSEVSFSAEELDELWLNEKEEVIYQSTTINNYEK
jgi:hypothetical protein